VSFLANAITLSKSLKSAGHLETHYVLIIDYDKKYSDTVNEAGFTPVFLRDLMLPETEEFLKRYDAFELANILKPYFFEWLFKKHKSIEYLIYLDTDIYVYSTFAETFRYFEDHPELSVLITPHILNSAKVSISEDYSREQLFLLAGLYNGGFYALRNSKNTFTFLKWHKSKLKKHGYNDPYQQMYVDQKILDFAPLLFAYVGVYRNPCYNIGHWNYFRGMVKKVKNKYSVNGKEIVFFHFSQIRVNEDDIGKSTIFHHAVGSDTVLRDMLSGYWKELLRNDYERLSKLEYGHRKKYKKKHSYLTSQIPDIGLLKSDVLRLKKALDSTQDKLSRTMSDFAFIQNELNGARKELHRIYASKSWKIIYYAHRIKDLFSKFLKPRHLSADPNSKKLVYVGHSYHAKTKSTVFLIDLLKEHFDVTEIQDESWLGKAFPDLSFVNETYAGVVFFQNLPPVETFRKIKNGNLIAFPMYDAYGGFDEEFWKQYRSMKFINFSKTLHEKLNSWGFSTMHIRYFPPPQPFTKNGNKKAFFWQRKSIININTVERLLGKAKIKLHIHRAIDPLQEFVKPSGVQEKKYGISYSEWHRDRSTALSNVQKCGIYIAPRDYEGIGLSFLEAMAMGKAVIAPNNPTMNEYITHNENGYLYSMGNVSPIDLTQIKRIRDNAYSYMKKGYKEWLSKRMDIINFIKKT
jgi:glycosyltransferase involved in cell wall biosynthesis